MNFIGLIGNLTADPEVRTTQSNVTVCSFRLAVQREFKNPETGKRDADFFQIAAWRQLGELCGKYLRKGKKACVVGHLESRSYVDKDGVKRYTVEVVADHVEFLSPRPDSGYETSRQEEKYPDFPYQEGGELPFEDLPQLPY